MKKCISFILMLLMCFFTNPILTFANADNTNDYENIEVEDNVCYKIYTESGDLIAEKQSVNIGDSILTIDFVKYVITQIDTDKGVAFAKFEERLRKPEVNVSYDPNQISQDNPTICLYMTHNDESYIIGDGYDSIYGAGGIHDIANLLKDSFENLGVLTHIDESLHIPHDSYAYSRSSNTAKDMIIKYSPDAIFDIHRDGASRSTYVKKVNGQDKCKIRIVVGKASSNFKIAEQFAIYLLSVAEEVCDWLFLDIYYASGHYNQGLYNKALLFEMGSHLVEKTLVEETVPELAKVINTALFNTTVDKESGNLTINGNADNDLPTISGNQENVNQNVDTIQPTINEVLDELAEKNNVDVNKASTITYFVVVVFGAGVIAGIVLSVLKKKDVKKKRKKS